MPLFDVTVKATTKLTIAAGSKAAATRAARKAFEDKTLDLNDLDFEFHSVAYGTFLKPDSGGSK
jgi:hypothetical protein